MFVFCEEYYVECEKLFEDSVNFVEWQDWMNCFYGKVEVIIGKQCYGLIGIVDLLFEGQFICFGNFVKFWQNDGGYE